MSDLRPLSVSVVSIARQSFAKKFIALSKILEHWADVIGSDYSTKAQPIKLSYRKPKTKDEKPTATLHIMADPSEAAALHYQSELILERLNQIFGEKWITRIKFEPYNEGAFKSSEFQNFTLPLSALPEAEKNRVFKSLENISDPELRLRLEKLGESVLRKSLLKS